MTTLGQETDRFSVVEKSNGKYAVIDTSNDKTLRFGFNVPPLYGDEEWGNYYSARGFCQRMDALQKRGR